MIDNLVRILKTNLPSFSYRKWPSRPELSNKDRYPSHWCWCVFSEKKNRPSGSFLSFKTICPCLYFDCRHQWYQPFLFNWFYFWLWMTNEILQNCCKNLPLTWIICFNCKLNIVTIGGRGGTLTKISLWRSRGPSSTFISKVMDFTQ